jgi:hypothetical protein
MSAHELPVEVASLESIPAVVDAIERQLAEARTLPEVKGIRDKAEALRLYARRRGAAVEAQNGCARLVFLAERQIGEELARAQEAGEVAKLGTNQHVRDADTHPATLGEIGLSRQRAAEHKALAAAPAGAIDKAVAAANAEQRPVTKADLRRAVEKAAAPAKRPAPAPAPAETKLRIPPEVELRRQDEDGGAAPKLRVVHDRDDQIVEQVCHLCHRLREVSEKISPETLHRKVPARLRHNLDLSLGPASAFLQALGDLHAAARAGKAREGEP